MVGFKPRYRGEQPTLGWHAIKWIEENLASPGFFEYKPFKLYKEQKLFLLKFYALNARGERIFHRSVLSRPRGWGKSPFSAAIAVFECAGPCRFRGWKDGRPVAGYWWEEKPALVQLSAATSSQVQNAWMPLESMLRDAAPIHTNLEDVQVKSTGVFFPFDCSIRPITSSARSVKGAPTVFVVMDQTETWTHRNSGIELSEVIHANLAKTGGTCLEVPNAFTWGEDSVAERSYLSYVETVKHRDAYDSGVLFDHREAPQSLNVKSKSDVMRGLKIAYGDTAKEAGGHVDLRHVLKTFFDPAQSPERNRSDFLNQLTSPSAAYITKEQLDLCVIDGFEVSESEPVFLGFDGSRGRRGVGSTSDATALVGCTMDGRFFNVHVWEQPPNTRGWEVPVEHVDRVVRRFLETHNVYGFFCDTAYWGEYVNLWARDFGRKMIIKAHGRMQPLHFLTNSKDYSVSQYLEEMRISLIDGEIKIGSPKICEHILNARKVFKSHDKSKYLLYKESSSSPYKIDAAYAMLLAYICRAQALRLGYGYDTSVKRRRISAV